MAQTPKKIGQGEGGTRIAKMETLLNDIADDLKELRTQFVALLQKLDTDGGITDTDYESTLTPAERKHKASDE